MSNTPPTGPAGATFEIAYQEFGGTRYNPDLRGAGTLVVRESPVSFVFTGHKRRLFSFSGNVEMAFAPTDIWNVRVDGRRLQFTTGQGLSGRRRQPFLFFARTPEEAIAIAALLPSTSDNDYAAESEFMERLRQLAPNSGAWTLPTNLIIAANIVVFILMGVAGAGWFEVGDIMVYARYGANRADITTDGEWWRLLTSVFIHFGLIHLVLNMWALLQAGHLAERLFGRAAYTVAYLGSGIVGSLASLLWHRESLIWSAGASGAVFGIYGSLLGYIGREKHGLPRTVVQPLLKSTLVFAAYNLLYGFARAGIDNAAHLGGLVGGALLGWLLAMPLDREVRIRQLPGRILSALAAVAIIAGAGIALAPHFEYRLMDEIAWGNANKAPGAKEPEMVKQLNAGLEEYQRTKDSAALVKWLTTEGIPFYSQWRDQVAALQLAPNRTTETRRKAFGKVLQMQLETYEHLAQALRDGKATALEQFQSDEKKTAAEVKKISAGKK